MLFCEIIGAFLENQCNDNFFAYFSFVLNQKRQFCTPFFCENIFKNHNIRHLILVDLPVLELGFSLLLEGDDDEGDEDVDEEEGEDDEEDDVEDGHLDPEQRKRTLVLVGGGHGVLQNAAAEKMALCTTYL
jgi:hypothetical protein